jgi:transposase
LRNSWAERGELATAGEIKRAFEARVGQEVAESTIYRLLDRHGWRKLMPRPKHPKASSEAQEQFKKPLRRRSTRLWRGGLQKITARSC